MLYDSRNDVEFTCAACGLRKTDFGKLDWVADAADSDPEHRWSKITCLACTVAEGSETPSDK